MYKRLMGFGLNDEQIKSVMKLYNERDMLKKAETALVEDIKGYGAKNASIVKKLLSKESLKFENGKITGYEKQIEAMKANPETSFLFEEENGKNTNEADGGDEDYVFRGIVPSESSEEVKSEDLSYEDLCEIL